MKRGFPRDHQSGGPLVTNHLRDLDMELELLKRKRLMIEQQILSNDRFDQQPYQRNQPQYDQPRNYDRNFSHLYDDGRQGGGRSMDSQYGVNYQPVRTNWELRPSDQYTPQPADNRSFPNRKTFASKPRNNYAPPTNYAPNKNFNQQNNKASKGSFNNTQNTGKGFFNNTQNTGKGFFNNSQNIGKGSFKNNRPSKYVPPSNRPNKTGPVRKDFNPTKVTKPKNKATNVAPNKLSSKPVENRRALVEKAIPLSKEKTDGDWVLVADQQPPAKVLGRMELALGTLLKELRERYACYSEYFDNGHYLREIKKELRLRIRKVLLGKVVPQQQQIITIYRSEFPLETDRSLLELCRAIDDTEKLKDIKMKFLPEADPEKFFIWQFHRLFSRQLNKLYKKLFQDQQKEADKSLDDLIAELPDIFVKTGAVDKTNEVSDKDGGDAEEIAAETLEGDSTQDKPENNESVKESSEQTPTEDTNVQQEEAVSESTDKQETNTAIDVAVENGNDSKEEVADSKETAEKIIPNQREKFLFYRNLIEKMIETKLPHLLFKRKDLFINCLDLDTTFRTARGGVLMEANRIAESLNKLPAYISGYTDKSENQKKNQIQKQNQIQKESETETTPLNQTGRKASYFVKVVGQPNLPDKKIMKVFIDTFNPKSIKKHKHMHNLLFIGFSCEADMEKILSADGTTVGNKKLIIKASGKIFGTQNKETQNVDAQNTSTNLNQEINNLVSTVRNSTEGNDCTKAESEFDQDGDVEMTAEGNESSEKVTDENVDANEADLASIKEEGETSINTEDATGDISINADNATGDLSKNTENVTGDVAITKENATADVESSTTQKESAVETPTKAETEVINEKLEAVKDEVQPGRATPTRASSRLGNVVTPSTVRTRRASKLVQNN